jgi:hypothetical protein
MSSKSKRGNGKKAAQPQEKLMAQPPQQRTERQFLVGESTLTELVQYIQAVPSGNMPGGAAIKLFMACQQLPELQTDGSGSFTLKPPPGMAPRPVPAPEVEG